MQEELLTKNVFTEQIKSYQSGQQSAEEEEEALGSCVGQVISLQKDTRNSHN